MNTDYALLVGLDWADQKHDLCWRETASGHKHTLVLENKPERISEWVAEQLSKFPGGRIAVCLEQSRGAVAHALMGYEQLDLYPVNPLMLAKYRGAFHPSGAKDDAHDAALLLDLLERHRESIDIWRPDTEETRLLQRLCQDRRKAVDQQTKLTNSLRSQLKEYYPQAQTLAGDDLSTEMSCAFLSKWSTFEAVTQARPDTLRRFYYKYNARSETKIQARLDLITASQSLTNDKAVIESGMLRVKTLIPQIRALQKAIKEYNQRISDIFKAHPDAPIFESLPGAGPILAPRLIAVFGTDRGRFKSAVDVAAFTGVAPVIERSGTQMWTHWRWHCPKFVRQSLVEFAGHSIVYCRWARAYYDEQIKRGKKHQAAVRALAFKWVRIIFRCWQSRTPYDEDIYLAALQQHGSWIAGNMK